MLAKLALATLTIALQLTGQTRNNVLVVIADDMGVEQVRAYGENKNAPPTPNLERLARGGVLFRNAWANPVCSPTRACIQTGRYSFRTGVGHAIPTGKGGELRIKEFTLPQALDAGRSGYGHAAIGKWHLGEATTGGEAAPNLAGWSYFAGVIQGALGNYFSWPRTVNGTTQLARTYATTQMVDDTLAWIKRQHGPWVCYLALTAPHAPFHAPPASLHSQDLRNKNPWGDEPAFYAAMVEAMDREIGRLLANIDTKRTDVIFIGDNGTSSRVARPPYLPSHAKSTPYEGGVHVPLIVSGPSVKKPGREVDALVDAVDLYATILELAAVDARAVTPKWLQLDSVSFAPYLGNPSQAALREFSFAEAFSGFDWPARENNGFATIRDTRFKLIRRYDKSPPVDEFYDLAGDPFERTDLMAKTRTVEAQRHYDALRTRLERLRQPTSVLMTFGSTDCIGSAGRPTIAGRGRAIIGSRYEVFLIGAVPHSPAVLSVGLQAEQWATIPLPLDLTVAGAPGCKIWCSTELMVPMATDIVGLAARSVPLPNDPTVIGYSFFHAWWNLDLRAPNNSLGLTTSNALAVQVGR